MGLRLPKIYRTSKDFLPENVFSDIDIFMKEINQIYQKVVELINFKL